MDVEVRRSGVGKKLDVRGGGECCKIAVKVDMTQGKDRKLAAWEGQERRNGAARRNRCSE